MARASIAHSALSDYVQKYHEYRSWIPDIMEGTYGMFDMSSPPSVLDLHSKTATNTPQVCRSTGVKGFVRGYSVSKTLQQLMGLHEPEPFAPPPEVPGGLEKAFINGLAEYGLYKKVEAQGVVGVGELAALNNKTLTVEVANAKLAEMRAENKRVIQNARDALGFSGNEGVRIDPPAWKSSNQAAAEALAFLQEDYIPDEDNAIKLHGIDFGQHHNASRTPGAHERHYIDYTKVDDTMPAFDPPGFGSSMTHVDNSASQPASFATAARTFLPQTPDTNVDSVHLGSFARASEYGGHSSYVGSGHETLRQLMGSRLLHQQNSDATLIDMPTTLDSQNAQVHNIGYEKIPQQTVSGCNVLFPSPSIKAETWNSRTIAVDFAASGLGSDSQVPGISVANSTQTSDQILPQKLPDGKASSKKRAHSDSLSKPGTMEPPTTRPRTDDTTGLPTLPAASEALWKVHFPGNTHALLTILLTWSNAMHSFYSRLPTPDFPFHSAFPYPIQPPNYEPLVSISFYDTSTTPHKELHFLGPGDAAEMIYAEVDAFRTEEGLKVFHEQQKQDCRVEALKKIFGFGDAGDQKNTRHMTMSHRAAIGEGRWVYILIKGHQNVGDDTPPHVMLAFHVSAITAQSTCFHTVLPDSKSAPAPSSAPPTSRSNSSQSMTTASQNSSRLHQSLRSASTSELPYMAEGTMAHQEGAKTLHRTMMSFDKAGSIPLIEGYRVDVVKFRAWMEAVGRGQGKLMMWRET